MKLGFPKIKYSSADSNYSMARCIHGQRALPLTKLATTYRRTAAFCYLADTIKLIQICCILTDHLTPHLALTIAKLFRQATMLVRTL